MGTSLTGLTPATTYDALIKVGDNGPLSATAKYLSDGLGNDSVLALSTSSVGVGTNDPQTILNDFSSSARGIAISNNYPFIGFNDVDGGKFFVGTQANLGYIWNNGTSDLLLATNAAERMRITSTGNVGIGTSTPLNRLHVFEGSSGATNNGATLRVENSGSSNSFFVFQTATSVGNSFNVTNAGNVGIGTTTPYTSLTIGTSDATAEISSGGSNTHLTLKTVGASGALRVFTIGGGTNTLATTETMRITSDGYLRMASGTGGIQFNGDTAAANALDDYEEGTWTPTFAGSTTNPTITYAVQSGFYTKIGRQVTITVEIGTSANTGGVGSLQVSGLPFTVASRVYNGVATYNINNAVTNPMGIFAEVNALGTKIDFLATGDNTTWTAVNWTDATNAVIYINGSFTYFV